MKELILGFLFVVVCSSCPSGWVKFEDECYWFERSHKMPWQNARDRCISMKSYLVKIYSDRENNFIRNELRKIHPGKTNEDQFWTAGNDLQKETEFRWAGTNDLIVEYTDWSPGEPNQNGGQEDCIAFFPIQDFHWNDEHCDRNEFFVCEQLDQNSTAIVG